VKLDLSNEQELFRETCRRFLTDSNTLGQARHSRETVGGYDPSWWRAGAEVGLTAMFVPEDQGGGSVSGSPVQDAVIAAEELGRVVAPGPFHPVNIVASAVARSGSLAQREQLLPGMSAGEAVGTWAFGEPRSQWNPDEFAVRGRLQNGAVTIEGTKSYVEAADVAEVLLVAVSSREGISQILVPSASPGVRIEPQKSLDLSRRFSTVHFDNVRVPLENVIGGWGAADEDLQRQLQLSLVLQIADSVGVIGHAFERTCQYAQDRIAFGRPIGSFQALKHRIADMFLWLESCRAISDGASAAVGDHMADALELVHTAKVFVSYRAVDIVQECIQIHGGIGLTWEHDMHLFLRRVGMNRVLYGTPEQHERQLSELLGV
jgi:alkylation response protein AidB-like acyl-CoA dehydrogenase